MTVGRERLIRRIRLAIELYDEDEYATEVLREMLTYLGAEQPPMKELPEQEICGTWIKKKEDKHG
ncbi:MAG: hypothetical protein IKS31_01430 [Clostridia bacterium]|nr:hypothetical protein [Clostridia bacterium]